jgi:acyl-coenzyme A thioesterase PaaI-like protein
MPVAQSLQVRFAAASRCFGCGPANPSGLHLETLPSPGDPDEVVATWQALPIHEAFAGVVNGGICGTLLDCAMNWAAVWRLIRERPATAAPDCVTAELSVRFTRPTPSDRPVVVRARAVESDGRRVVCQGTIEADGVATATANGTFVAVGPGHPASGRWRATSGPTSE